MKLVLLLFFIVGCAQVTSLNLRKHQFGLTPTKIIWFQIAGFEEEHLAMLRFQQTADKKTSFENSICLGQAWNYNLYLLRPSAESSFLAQLTGKKNIKNSCEDASLRPIWSYIGANGYETAILETGASPAQSLTAYQKCPGHEEYLKSLYFYSRSKPKENAKTFHYAENVQLIKDETIYDRTCGDNDCSSSITDDFISLYEKLKKTSDKHMIIVRDFSYLRALEAKDLKKAREILFDIERAHGLALKNSNQSDYLILISTGDSKFIDMPNQGKPFFDFDKDGSQASFKREKLTNLILASGARAENFCGIYEDTSVFERILSGPKQQGLELKIINPFN